MTAMPATPATHAPTGDCIRCGFERRETPWTTCPECGADAQTRERLRRRTAAALAAIELTLGMAASLMLLRFATVHVWLAGAGDGGLSTARSLEWDAAMRSTTSTAALLLAATAAAALLTSRALAGTEHRTVRARILTGVAIALTLVALFVFGEQLLGRTGVEQQQQQSPSQVARSVQSLLRTAMQLAPVASGALLALALLPEFPTLARARSLARIGVALAFAVVVAGNLGLAVRLPASVVASAWFPMLVYGLQIAAALTALAACTRFDRWLQTQRAAPELRAPGEPLPPGATLTLADAMDRGGIPLGLVVGLLGVMPWVIWSSPNDDALLGAGPPAWMTARWIVTAAAALAWVIPAYLLPNPRAARWWKWSAAATILAAAALAGR